MLGNLGLELWFNWRQALIYNKEWISLLDLLTLDSAETEKKNFLGVLHLVCVINRNAAIVEVRQ